ncbi:MAG: hypothetical protein ACHQAY_10225 [Hyphomicrobiales bacterium]
MTPPDGAMFCRRFSAETEALASVWSDSAMSTEDWRPTGRKWPTNSQPLEVVNANNIRGVAKPGALISDRCLRAAHEKIAADLAYVLGLPVPPVILWDRGDAFVGDRYCAISMMAFTKDNEWDGAAPHLTADQISQAMFAAGAMTAFDTWLAASDRKTNHVLVDDNGDQATLGLAYIDYAFSMSYEWLIGQGGTGAEPRPTYPDKIGFSLNATRSVVEAIEKIDESVITKIVNRIPASYFIDNAEGVILSALLMRRTLLRSWLGL